jgi:hypothetical protein
LTSQLKQISADRATPADMTADWAEVLVSEAELFEVTVFFMANDYGIILSGGTHRECFRLVVYPSANMKVLRRSC